MSFLKEVFRENKKVITFLVLFFGIYILLSILYHFYLKANPAPDFFTSLVALQTQGITQNFGYTTRLETVERANLIRFFLNENYVVKIIEGCNGISVMILFVSFVLAFKGNFFHTFLFLLAGLALIYSFNILRIVALAIGILEYPAYKSFLHDIFFPGVIYGTVFLLWVIWVKQVSKNKR